MEWGGCMARDLEKEGHLQQKKGNLEGWNEGVRWTDSSKEKITHACMRDYQDSFSLACSLSLMVRRCRRRRRQSSVVQFCWWHGWLEGCLRRRRTWRWLASSYYDKLHCPQPTSHSPPHRHLIFLLHRGIRHSASLPYRYATLLDPIVACGTPQRITGSLALHRNARRLQLTSI
ncbi:hypothetical protein BS50DRAFT_176693 [Corynespora cassiicola Philippines]|uniref:Uncharacterized protein n=1 Tax=Corynespora cassiicola Philippines TaxID=1448308 RepID=A0A2T2P5R1_CORCC|nr:hypothetical protein BS50DRAFT_176693 [Corynespora cassiicola Philippines]